MPLLSIYTPTYCRPTLLEMNMRSVAQQTAAAEVEHLVVRDEVGVGVAGMFAEIPRHLEDLRGEYVYLLQDDDILAGPDVVARLEAFIQEQAMPPPVVMVRNRKGPLWLPMSWGERPARGRVDLGNVVTRRDVFAEHAWSFGQRYDGDFDFIDTLWEMGYPFAWCDVLFAQALAWGRGRPEGALLAQASQLAGRVWMQRGA